MLSTLYAAVVRRRRERYAARPDLRRRLRHPVISIGNLAVGGRAKTPTVACVARLLVEMGERPAILSRGYARQSLDEGVVVVRDPHGIRSDLHRAGDEPLMLARQLAGTCVLVCPDRYLAGRLAEHHFAATVHVLDDGFQHLMLDRDADIVLIANEDVRAPRTLPRGRLREPIDTLVAADAIVALDEDVRVEQTGVDIPIFGMRKHLSIPPPARSAPAFAIAGIAAPHRFFTDLRSAGCSVTGTRAFRDHHPYSARDLERIVSAARASGATQIVTTEKDFVRLLPLRPFPMPIRWTALTMEPDPLPDFRRWLADAVWSARDVIVD
ncbi:MAG TPA: tetraacyldisaccharide 4'-kinase [Vicinamibacterales bacterium]|nr:tetraacyldisaccharide 4'-kinase [Vicinamibacterales bacterium]